MVVLETAQAAKFNDVILAALGINAPRPDAYIDIEKRPQRVIHLNNDAQAVKQLIQKHTA